MRQCCIQHASRSPNVSAHHYMAAGLLVTGHNWAHEVA